jgi:hypothetical protein
MRWALIREYQAIDFHRQSTRTADISFELRGGGNIPRWSPSRIRALDQVDRINREDALQRDPLRFAPSHSLVTHAWNSFSLFWLLFMGPETSEKECEW